MITKDKENEEIQEQFESKEAGITELLEFYARVEAIYVSSSKASEETEVVVTSNSTNSR